MNRAVGLVLFSLACSGGAQTDSAAEPEPTPAVLSGLYQLGLGVAPVSGMVVQFQMDLEAELHADGETTFSFDILPVGDDGVPGESMGRVEDVELDEDLGFVADFGSMIWPGAYSPIGSDIELISVFAGTLTSETSFCGTVTGEIATFGMNMEGSTFAAVAWEDRTEDPPSICEDSGAGGFDPIAECPALSEGRNFDFPSGDEDREFELILPETYDAAQAWPLVFAWHGITSDIHSIVSNAGLEEAAENYDAIFVAPQSRELGGVSAWDPVNGDGVNLDLLFFDDLLTCMTEQYNIDSDRVSTTGISNGGLFIGVLIVERSEVVAAAAPMSGGINVPYEKVPVAMPTLVLWGGETDVAFDQDFHVLSTGMIDTLVSNEHFVVSCDTGLGHTLKPSFMDVVMPFLADHPLGVDPLPYTEGLPDDFADYCSIASR